MHNKLCSQHLLTITEADKKVEVINNLDQNSELSLTMQTIGKKRLSSLFKNKHITEKKLRNLGDNLNQNLEKTKKLDTSTEEIFIKLS